MRISPTRTPWHFLVNADADAYEILFSFSSPEEKRQFLNLIRTNEDLGNDYIENDFMLPTTEEIRNARPLQTILPEDVLIRAVLIATSICVGAEDDRSSQDGIHTDDTYPPSTGSSNTVTGNTINEACARILLGSRSGNTTAPNSFLNLTNTTLAGDTYAPLDGPSEKHQSLRPSAYKMKN
jgi:hypothetical protein